MSIDGEEYVPRRLLDDLRGERDRLAAELERLRGGAEAAAGAGDDGPAVRSYYVVRETCGPAWDRSRPRREQAGWDDHAAFMDKLVADAFVFLGGPVGEVNTGDPLLVVEAEDEAAVRARLADDPWADTVLTIRSVEPWTVWLRRERL